MKVHHLNCATMCPWGQLLINGKGSLFAPAEMICHCLLIETNDGLVLVDTGIGLADIEHPQERLSLFARLVVRPVLDPAESAAAQVQRLGFKISDVRHIIPTHLDFDHVGGLPDFPHAKVHVFRPEYEAAMRPRTFKEKDRYRSTNWAHQPEWVCYDLAGERWEGFEAVRAIPELGSEVLLVPTVGHTRGHVAVAVRTPDTWLLHCGDAYFFHQEVSATGYCPIGLRWFQSIIQMNGPLRRQNQARLRSLAQTSRSSIQIFCAHDPVELHQWQK
jgi:glyoxylase-like metal-dependent hydrolase (beta-lactamase superfamily II)